MNTHDDKVIPTLDDVISVGDPELDQLGDINALEDDFDDEFDDAIALGTSDGDSHDDDGFEDAFDSIALSPDGEQGDTDLDEVKIDLFDSEMEADSDASANSEDLDQSITDIIVAERFPEKENAAPAETPATAVEKTPVTDRTQPASGANQTVKTQTTKTAMPEATLSPGTTPTIKTEILISEIVDEITHQLLPEIEWKIRTRVRDILEQHLSDKS